MNIIDATKIAINDGKWIYRSCNPTILFKPTNTTDCYLILVAGFDKEPGKRWNPQAEDILADDYVVSD